MEETDWREILSFSQRELMQADKDKLCENLSWMEADDIELNFTDLKTLFRLAQDVLKYKSEQVNDLMGELGNAKRKGSKLKQKSLLTVSPVRSSHSAIDTITQQEEVIKANKEILQQLHSEIAQLDERKNQNTYRRSEVDIDSESSRDPLSEINATIQLENEITKKNRHIIKLLADVKILEEENVRLKQKLSQVKDKLNEATQLIENLSEQLFSINGECHKLKVTLGKCEKTKYHLLSEIESLNKEISARNESKQNLQEDVKSQIQYLKDSLKSHKNEIDRLSAENTQLKEKNILSPKPTDSPKKEKYKGEVKIKELEDKLIEASNKIEQSANLIKILKRENKRLRDIIEEGFDVPIPDNVNQSDDGKEKSMISKLKGELKNITVNLRATEQMLEKREKELAEITSHLQLVQSDVGINTLLKGLKNKKHLLKLKDDGIKHMVIEVNNLNQYIENLELENETLRQKLKIPPEQKVSIQGILKKYQDIEQNYRRLKKETQSYENRLVSLEIENRSKTNEILKLYTKLNELGFDSEKIKEMLNDNTEEEIPMDDTNILTINNKPMEMQFEKTSTCCIQNSNIQTIIDENEGLRVALQEILQVLKDNSTTSSGILSLKCPSLEAMCQSLDARHAAGWFAPHMRAVMDLKVALGGKDALLDALHESRKETFEIMNQLSRECKKSSELEQKLFEIKSQEEKQQVLKDTGSETCNNNEFGNWMCDHESNNIDFHNQSHVEKIITNGNIYFESQIKKSLHYFQDKFKSLHDKLASLTIIAEDNQNKWSIKEENYKAEIESLKAQIQQSNCDDDTSTESPGILSKIDINGLQRKITYLEESYKQIRTINENIKNEHSEYKREMMLMTCEYEAKIQSYLLHNINLTDKLCRSVPAQLFWKQNIYLNELTIKYRKSTEIHVNNNIEKNDLLKRIEENKLFILKSLQNNRDSKEKTTGEENYVLEKQLEEISAELNKKDVQINNLNKKIEELQITSGSVIDTLIMPVKEEGALEEQIFKLRSENNNIKQERQSIQTQLDLTLLKLHEIQQKKFNTDIEINLLRHQILDLQSTGDNKAIIARLSGEILMMHLQMSESKQKIQTLNLAINKEKEMRTEAENILKSRQEVLNYYIISTEKKFRNIFNILQVFRQEYQGSLPQYSIEKYLTNIEQLNHKTYAADEKLNEIEDLRLSLLMKHSIYNEILESFKGQCLDSKNNYCEHEIKNIVTRKMKMHELEHCKKKIQSLEQSRKEVLNHCDFLERTLVLINRAQKITTNTHKIKHNTLNINENESTGSIDLEDIRSEDNTSSCEKGSQTYSLLHTKLAKPLQNDQINGTTNFQTADASLTSNYTGQIPNIQTAELVDVNTQTNFIHEQTATKIIQTQEDHRIQELQEQIHNRNREYKKKIEESTKVLAEIQRLNQNESVINEQNRLLQSSVQNLTDLHIHKDSMIKSLQSNIVCLKKEIHDFKQTQYTSILKEKNAIHEQNLTLLQTLKEVENEKSSVIAEYKQLLTKEREEYAKTIKDLQTKILMAQSQMDGRAIDVDITKADVIEEPVNNYIVKITELEDKCFKLQSDLNVYKTEGITCQSELDRWKKLACDRLSKMQQLSAQLKERHNTEMESYKEENQHWLTQLNETQREHTELRSRLTEQKAVHVKQLADKDAHIEQLRIVVNNLKTQMMNMQTMLSVNDPSFDLSAIVEVEETSDAVSPQGSERLELKFESTVDLQDFSDDYMRAPATSTAIWHEPLVERLRREKQLIGKQNAILRRQIKAVAARERRARLDAQNLKNQVFRISTSGSKGATAESAALQNKIASLQAQLTSARRDAHSTVAIWDKWKRAQQAADRWQARYEEKCQEEKKLETSLNLIKSALSRLEKEKRVLLTRISELKSERSSALEKQDQERSEKGSRSQSVTDYSCDSPPPIPTRALLDRIQAQQRRIAALEVAEKGNEPLVSEYERALAEITSLKGQVLKLESTLLESQIRIPQNPPPNDTKPELEYWKSYCDMLKEENMTLTLRVNSLETTPASAHQHRMNDLEQTVLTLRGLVSKMQADQKSGATSKRVDSRPGSGRSNATEKVRSQIDTYRAEISNLKRTIQEKDLLLEKSKEMLKIAAEREDYLLKENMLLRRRFDELVERNGGFLSA